MCCLNFSRLFAARRPNQNDRNGLALKLGNAPENQYGMTNALPYKDAQTLWDIPGS